VTLKDKIFAHIKKHGPQTNAELVATFKVLKASVRRVCGDLVREGKLSPALSDGVRCFGLSSEVRASVAPPAVKAPAKKPEENKTPVVKDWRDTNFCF
jgi:DNA-binding IclR family transcriptional regulator